MRTRTDEWVVDTSGLTDDELVRTARQVLASFAPDVAEVELDVVAPDGGTPSGFAEAASLLRRRGGGPAQDPGYWTFRRAPVDDEVWAAVLTVVPFSYSAQLYGPDGGTPVISLADEATSLVVRATGSRLAEVGALVGEDRLISVGDWDARRRASRKDARRRRSPRAVDAPRS